MKSGDIFWARSQGIADEEQGRHPWIVISKKEVALQGRLVIAVPVTSNPILYKRWDVYVTAGEIACAVGVTHPLDPNKLEGVVKCAKIQHWSIERIDEVVGHATSFFVNKLRSAVADALEISRIH
jgi:mRNA-degrading endonuclease toxin of MazEF toxin-antitoxin module